MNALHSEVTQRLYFSFRFGKRLMQRSLGFKLTKNAFRHLHGILRLEFFVFAAMAKTLLLHRLQVEVGTYERCGAR